MFCGAKIWAECQDTKCLYKEHLFWTSTYFFFVCYDTFEKHLVYKSLTRQHQIFHRLKNLEFCIRKWWFAEIINFLFSFKKSTAESHRMLVKACDMLYQKKHAKDGFNDSEIIILTWEMKNVENNQKKTPDCKRYWMMMTLLGKRKWQQC